MRTAARRCSSWSPRIGTANCWSSSARASTGPQPPENVAHGRTIRRGGSYNRLAEPSWADLLDTSHSLQYGGRWNPPGSFGVLYLNRDLRMARLQVQHKLIGHPYGVED